MRKPGNQRRDEVHAGRLRAWLAHHAQSALASLGRLLGKPWASLLTVAVMALALALPLGLWLALTNVQRLGGQVQAAREMTVFLKPAVDLQQAQALAGRLRARSDVAALTQVTPEQALAQLRGREDLAAAIDALGAAAARAALPQQLRLLPRDDGQALLAALQALPETDQVQFDAVWRKRLQAWLDFGTRVVQVLALLFGLGALLVVGNTVRLDIQARREEIGVLQLLGASDGFVRRPFLYLGIWYGLAAGALALVVLTVAELALRPTLADLAARYGSRFALQGLGPLTAVAVLLMAALLGWLGAGLVAGQQLRQTRPQEG